MRRTCVLATTFALAVLCATVSQAAILQFAAFLDGLQETPPVATPGYGSGLLTLDDSDGTYKIAGNFADLIGTSNNAHIHGPGAPGKAAGVIHGLTFDLGVNTGKYSGANTFTKAQMTDLKTGLYYVNIHTTFRPGGEIRGQLEFIPEPATVTLLGVGGFVLAGAAWRRSRRRDT